MSNTSKPARWSRLAGLLPICLCAVGPAAPGDLTLPWSTIDAGGCVATGGTGLSLAGTIGQPDGNAALAATNWQLIAGFWSAAPGTVAGDCTGDGAITFADFAALAGCQAGPYIAPAQGCTCADHDADGDVDLADLAALQCAFGAR